MDKEALDKTVAEYVGIFKDIAKSAIEAYEGHRNKYPYNEHMGLHVTGHGSPEAGIKNQTQNSEAKDRGLLPLNILELYNKEELDAAGIPYYEIPTKTQG